MLQQKGFVESELLFTDKIYFKSILVVTVSCLGKIYLLCCLCWVYYLFECGKLSALFLASTSSFSLFIMFIMAPISSASSFSLAFFHPHPPEPWEHCSALHSPSSHPRTSDGGFLLHTPVPPHRLGGWETIHVSRNGKWPALLGGFSVKVSFRLMFE